MYILYIQYNVSDTRSIDFLRKYESNLIKLTYIFKNYFTIKENFISSIK